MENEKFHPGDIVELITGSPPLIVIDAKEQGYAAVCGYDREAKIFIENLRLPSIALKKVEK